MRAKPALKAGKTVTRALKALRRAAKKAIELARQTGTHAYVLENGQIVDAAKQTHKTRRTHK